MATRLYFIRHGHTDWIGCRLAGRFPGVHLSANGREQSARIPTLFPEGELTALYSSPMERALETAEPLAKAQGLEITVENRITEFDFGEWSGMWMNELQADEHWRRFNAFRIGTRPPGGELMIDVQARMVNAAERICNANTGENIAMVSHGDPIKTILMHYMGMPLDFHPRLEIEPASVSCIELDDWGARVLFINREPPT